MEATVTLVGMISDTHGLLRPEAVEALRGVERIIHAGDIGSFAVIDGLKALAPVVAVQGNCDHGALAAAFPVEQRIEVAGIKILVIHDRKELKQEPPGDGISVVVSGHSHKPGIEEKDGVLYVNPGSAGRRRFKLPVTVALLKVEGEKVSAKLVDLDQFWSHRRHLYPLH